MVRAASAWRPEDDAFLRCLVNEHATEALFRSLVEPMSGQELPPRARVVAELARGLAGGPDAVQRAADGEPKALERLLFSGSISGFSPALQHALAVLCERAERLRGVGSATRPLSDEVLLLTALASWLALEKDPSYLRDLGGRLAGDGAGEGDLGPSFSRPGHAFIDQLGAEAARGARELSPRAATLLRVLSRASEACRMAAVDPSLARSAIARADRARATAIDEALSPIASGLDDARARNAAGREAPAWMTKLASIWSFTGQDVSVEQFAVERVIPIAWEARQDRDWARMRTLLTPCRPLFERMEQRTLAEPLEHLSYSAHLAQVFVFLSEAEDWGKEIPWLERALRLCPAHRNARCSLAYSLCDRAIGMLARTTWFTARADMAEAERLITRAEQLFPQGSRNAEARSRLDEAKGRMGVST